MLRVVGIEDHDGLPAALAALGIVDLECGRDDQHGESQALGVDTGLDDLLRGAHRRAADDGKGNSQTGKPRGADNAVAVVAAIVHEALVCGLVLADNLLGTLGVVSVQASGILSLLVLDALAISLHNGTKGSGGCDEESSEWERQATERGISP